MIYLTAILAVIIGYVLGGTAAKRSAEKICNENELATVTLIHEVRNQLTGLKWIFNILSELKIGQTVNQEEISAVKDGNQKIGDILEIVSDTFNGIRNGESSKMVIEPVDIKEVIDRIIDEYKIQAEERNIKVVFSPSNTMDRQKVDRLKITQALRNMIGNAIKYSNNNSRVFITLKQNPNDTIVEVSDEGIGIPEKDKPRLFAKFFRAENALNQSGSGLGLYLAKNIIARHGGHIEVESKEGAGSKFTVVIPKK